MPKKREPMVLRNEFIEEIVETIRKDVEKSIKSKNTEDLLYKLVKKMGGDIYPDPSITGLREPSGSLTVSSTKNLKFVIKIPQNVPSMINNFTIAHELGHLFLHVEFTNNDEEPHSRAITFNRFGSNQQELEANKFAAYFLLPKEEFEKKRKEFRGSVYRLAAYFEVSVQTVLIRMDIY